MSDDFTPRVLMISARSDVGGGPAHMYTMAMGLMIDHSYTIFSALPSDGYYYNKLLSLVGQECIFEIPRQRFTLKALWRLFQWCRANQINLIHSHGKGAGVYSRLLGFMLGQPVVHTLHGYHDGRYGFLAKKIYAAWETFASFLTKKIICVSQSERALFLKKIFVAPAKIEVVRNGTPIAPVMNVAIKSNKIVTVARFNHQKNLLEFLRIAQALPGYQFHIIGDGEDRAGIEDYIAGHGISNMILHGESLKVLESISDADVYLSTSLWEGLPLAVLEAMSIGLPVVASNVVGNQDAVVPGITGYLYPLGDIDACIRNILLAKSLPRLAIRQQHKDHFSSAAMISETAKIYKDVFEMSSTQ
ncbi:MAG: glycosyltransferase [Polynucleobacter sp.]